MTGLPLSRSAASPRTPAAAAPYGAAELRRTANRTLLRGFAAASLLAVTAIGGGRWIADALATPRKLVVEPPWIIPLPPPLEAPSKPSTPAAPRLRTSPTPEVRALPTPVPDADAPETAPTLAPADGDVAAPGPDGDGVAGGQPDGSGVAPLAPLDPVVPAPVTPTAPDPAPVVPPPADPAPDVFTRVEVMPTVASRAMPVYPEMARHAGIEGRVTVRVRVGRDGRVKDASVVRSDHVLFDDAALDAVRRWTFTPGIQAGRPVEVWVTIPIRFRQTGR